MWRRGLIAFACMWGGIGWSLAARAGEGELPVLFQEDFEKAGALEKWEPTDAAQWRIGEEDGNKVLSLAVKASKYQPKVRSPLSYALIRGLWVGDFVLDLKLKSTVKPYGHQDLCLFFGWQSPTQFHYVHLAPAPDAAAHSIFIVNGKPRTSIARERSKGVVWGEGWHHVRIARKVADGTIQVYFDDMAKPIMVAQDKTFTWGRVGVGSFDDTGNYDDITLRGVRVEPPKADAAK